jgi:hypothetical protein
MAEEGKGPVDTGAQQADFAAEAAIAAEARKAAKEAKKPKDEIKPQTPAAVVPAAEVADDDDGESAGDEGEQQPAGEPGKKNTPRGVQKKLDKLTREKYVEREARLAAEAELQRLRTQATPVNPDPQKQPVAADGKPTLESCDYDTEKYLEALSDWKVDKRLKADREAQTKEQAAQSEREKVAAFRTREEAFTAANPDYRDVAYTAPINYSPAMLDFIRESDVGPAIAYHLAHHLDEAKAIEQMPALRQGIALDRLERQLIEAEAEPEPQQPARPVRTVTQAPKPPATVAPAASVKKSVYDENLTPSERIALWRRQSGAK